MGVKKEYKHTEVGIIPKDWKVTTIEDVAYVIGGGTPSTFNTAYWDGNINWFTPTEIGLKKYVSDSCRKITTEGLNNSAAKILPEGTVLLTTRASIGEVCILKKEASTNQGFQSLIAKKNIFNEYIYYSIKSLKNELLKRGTGSTFLEVSAKKIREFKIVIPSELKEQQAIATALSDVDELIAELEKLIDKKKNIKQATIQGLLRSKGEWDEVTIESLTKIFTKQTGFDYTSHIKPYLQNTKKDDTIAFIQNKDFKNKWINFEPDYFIPIEIACQFPRILLDEKCLLISISGSIGNVGIFSNKQIAFLGGAVAVLKFKDVSLLDWVMYYLLSNDGQNKLLGNVKSGSHQNLILDDIRKIKIPLPPYDKQVKITSILNDMNDEIESLEIQLAKYKEIKTGMMQELLTGKTRLI